MDLNREIYQAAIDVLNGHGFDILTPFDGDIDDLERERFDAVCLAIEAAIEVRRRLDRMLYGAALYV